ncbi:uncharacterized protein LOC114278224 [Camellia sinensis]|uniref:uncharacterized protein LOC114278224 n=1 Tax=Camellia sinensis TaxID=4442 RepID=UPI0010363F5E|nr:uncharacterized protein LOC114278224 [Camellia sinensis]
MGCLQQAVKAKGKKKTGEPEGNGSTSASESSQQDPPIQPELQVQPILSLHNAPSAAQPQQDPPPRESLIPDINQEVPLKLVHDEILGLAQALSPRASQIIEEVEREVLVAKSPMVSRGTVICEREQHNTPASGSNKKKAAGKSSGSQRKKHRFCPAGLSDRSPVVLSVAPKGTSFRKPFKYFNFWVDHKDFIPVVSSIWCKYVKGSPMLRTCCKLRSLKPLLKDLNKKDFCDLTSRVQCLKFELESAQIKLEKDPLNLAVQAYERDLNNQNNQNRSRISGITLENGVLLTSPSDVQNAFVTYFSNLFGTPHEDTYVGFDRVNSLINKRLTIDQMFTMAQDVTADEIISVFKSLNPNKAPGPDGYSAGFFHSAWEVGDYRPISCCNTIYKCIAKIIANRIKLVLPYLIDPVQSAFVHGRRIANNIFLSQELMRGYHKNSPSPKCAMKVDLMKAYDNVRWDFLFDVLKAMSFPTRMIHWIKACVASASFSVCINGSVHGHSPSFQLIKSGLLEFQALSGLALNPQKSQVFFSGCDSSLIDNILRITQFQEGKLPVRYLGVPLIPTRLKAIDCKGLVDRITNSLLVLPVHPPKKAIKEVEALCWSFLWSGLKLKKFGAKVAWDRICVPKNEGGLGFKSLEIWNRAAVSKHIWFMVAGGEQSMWCQWVKSYLLKGKSFWAVNVPGNPSWVWRKLLSLREVMYPLIRYKIGNGEDTFLWYDNWHPFGSLWSKYGNRLMHNTALNAQSKVAFALGDNGWTWPNASSWEVREITTHIPPDIVLTSGCLDKPIWLLHNDGNFSIGSIWNSWRMKWPKVTWANLVWSPYSIPRVGFIV